jgi:CO/xanthine dehydrogenase Mo-binding subunit
MRLRASTNQIVMPEICRRKPWRDPAAEATLPGQMPTNPPGVKGLGKIGIVGVAAAIANAVCHATASACRNLPITPDKLAR